MGGQPRFPYPKEVWSPSGGWWPYPARWRANTAVAFLIGFSAVVPLFYYSEQKMERVRPPKTKIPWRPNLELDENYRD